MKTLIALAFVAIAVTVAAVNPPTQVILKWTWLPDNTQMAGLSTNDYCTNITVLVLSTPNVATPTNQWPVVASIPVTSLLPQGPPGSLWSFQLTMDGLSRFYALVNTNGNGGASPFSNLAPGLTPPTAGVIQLPLKVQ